MDLRRSALGHRGLDFQAISTLHTEFSSTDNGIHLLDVQEKLHKFQLQESQVGIQICFGLKTDLFRIFVRFEAVLSGTRDVRDNQESG